MFVFEGVQFRTRAEWEAAPARRGYSRIPTPAPDAWVHHTAGPATTARMGLTEEAAYMRSIQRFHQRTRGWTDIAYNVIVFPSGRVWLARPFGTFGAHTESHNSTSHGFCAAGNFEKAVPTDALVRGLATAIRYARARGYTGRGRIGGHRDTKATACPGRKLYARRAEIARLVNAPTREEELMAKLDQEDRDFIAGIIRGAVVDVVGAIAVGHNPAGGNLPDSGPFAAVIRNYNARNVLTAIRNEIDEHDRAEAEQACRDLEEGNVQ